MCFNTKVTWLDFIDSTKIDPYPIQFANCDRLSKNNVVYIFDEVGSGKTISSGLMAMDFLMSHPDDRVLVITTNSLFKSKQFLKDWYGKLPYEDLGLEDRVDIVNNHFSSFKYEKKYGLVIIDEAHLFLNKNTQRYELLTRNIESKKIVFLTATPIKEGIEDLYVYIDIAKNILHTCDVKDEWIKEIRTIDKEKNKIICNIFDKEFPVTRYFKDTITSLRQKGYKKTKIKRTVPHVWKYKNESDKVDVMIKRISESLKKSNKDKFIIFTRYVEKEAKFIEKEFEESGEFVKFNNDSNENKSYYVVTGENAYELEKFSGKRGIPTVLILTYQIAEQGVNLPGYNHVINYHIPPFLSSLEQRFGRIDRMDRINEIKNQFDTINMCYLISDGYDTNTFNFTRAMYTCREILLSQLPSRNTILTEDIIKTCVDVEKNMDIYFQQLLNLCNDNQVVDDVYNSYIKYIDDESDVELEESPNSLLEFCINSDIELVNLDNVFEFTQELRKKIEITRKKIKKQTFIEDKNSEDILKSIINDAGDRIFYKKNESNIGFIDPVEYSACQISESNTYKAYLKEFNEDTRIRLIIGKYKNDINHYFENEFENNRLENIFPRDGYKKLFIDKILDTLDIKDKEHKEILIEKIDIIVDMIPFFKKCRKFRENLIKNKYTEKDYVRCRYDYNAFEYSLICTKKDIENQGMILNVEPNNAFYVIEENGITKASNWYKLAFHYAEKEEVFGKLSLFEHFIYGETGRIREYMYPSYYIVRNYNGNGMLKIEENDRWTRGICKILRYKI